MDSSETYIKMCEKAEEIQFAKQYQEGDYQYNKSIGVYFNKGGWWQGDIWLPRQDQLQEMLLVVNKDPEYIKRGYKDDWLNLFWRIKEFIEQYPSNPYKDTGLIHELFSWEQLWLAFVMKEKYNKVWNGADWVKEK